MLFCTTARGTAVVASILQQVSAASTQSMLPPIYQIQSRMSQAARTRAAQEFRDAPEGAVLVTSDVTARGMDFPRWVSYQCLKVSSVLSLANNHAVIRSIFCIKISFLASALYFFFVAGCADIILQCDTCHTTFSPQLTCTIHSPPWSNCACRGCWRRYIDPDA